MWKRTVALFAAVCVLFGALIWRTMEIARTLGAEAAKQTHTRTLIVGTSRGVIYDRNLLPLAPSDFRLLAAVAPCEAAMETMTAAFGKERAEAMLQNGAPALAEAQTEIDTAFVRTFRVPVRQGEQAIAAQLLGTVGSDGHGVNGAERALDERLSAHSGSLAVRFCVDAVGRVLPGEPKEIADRNFQSRGGAALTIDSAIQRAAEQALEESAIKSGCVVVLDTDTGEILAMANTPDSAVNRALQSYSVGSVFKPLLAAFALEHGVPASFSYTCTGECRIGDTRFQCFKGTAHGKQTMKQALENSCNTYFIRLMEELDAAVFLSFCRSLGFGAPLALCEGLRSDSGSLPAESDLLLPGERANFAFGQGRLLASPVQLVSVYQTLATGVQTPPTVLRGFVDETGALRPETPFAGVRRLSEKTVGALRRLLAGSAKAVNAPGAGKTGTAQSGVFENGKEICRTWFAGFFPAAAPRYAVAVLNENGVSGAADCAPVFRVVCENLAERLAEKQ